MGTGESAKAINQLLVGVNNAAVAEAMFLLPKSNLRRFATSNHGRGNLIVRTGQSGSAAVRALEERIRVVLEAAPLPSGFTTDVTGNATLPDGVEMVMPGDNVALNISLVTPIAMTKGLRFAIREGGRTVGAGIVSEITE